MIQYPVLPMTPRKVGGVVEANRRHLLEVEIKAKTKVRNELNFSKIVGRTSRFPRENLKTAPKTTGLGYWILRVLEECDQVSANFSADPVHDLRVALRRCRSMADGMMAMDPDREWKAMKKTGKQLFRRLGALRDVQIMMEWIERLEFEPQSLARTPSPALPHGADIPQG